MGFFDFFRSRTSRQSSDTPSPAALPDIKESDFIDNTDPLNKEDNGTITISYGTGMPIDWIYGSLKEDHEKQGYEDALCNPDQSYKEKNMLMIRSTLEVKFKQVILKYSDDLRDIDFHINSRSQAGLVDLVKQLEARKDMLTQHKLKLEDMERDFLKDAPYMMGVLLSYERGFTRGLAALSLDLIKQQQNV